MGVVARDLLALASAGGPADAPADVEVDAEQHERPQEDRQDRVDHLLEAVQMGEVIVVADHASGDQRADDDVHKNPEAGPPVGQDLFPRWWPLEPVELAGAPDAAL